ncbi:DUF7521 family protein [Halorussus halobius]|uniref:DUF7521 family protein n=1 Tax=Halorussus halobius TaxID=1710537 RepID=UPI001091BF06|nr:hypothetical protein [Halorussus halobius]
MTDVTPLVVALKTVTLVLGGLITFFAFKAYRRTGARPLRALAFGFGAVTLGSMVAGVLDRIVLTGGDYALVAESALTAVGFGVILYSLYVD